MSPFDPFRGGVAQRGQCPLFYRFSYRRASLSTVCYVLSCVHQGWLYLLISRQNVPDWQTFILTCDHVSREYMLMSLQNWKMSHTPLTSGALARMSRVAILHIFIQSRTHNKFIWKIITNIIREKMFTSQCFRFLATRWSPAVARRGDHFRNVKIFVNYLIHSPDSVCSWMMGNIATTIPC